MFLTLGLFSQNDSLKSSNTDFIFSVNRSLLGSGDYVAVMNEFGLIKRLKFSGFEASLNNVLSAQRVPYDENVIYNRSHSATHSYLRLNYFIEPIAMKNFYFNIGAGGLLGYVSNVNIIRQNIHFMESYYDVGWHFGYNIRLKLRYQVNRNWSLFSNAGYDCLSDGHTNFYYGMGFSYRIK